MSSKKISDLKINPQSGTDRTLYATWSFEDKKGHVDSYSYEWRYYVNKTWFDGSSGTSSSNTRSCTYDPPANAQKVEIRVKPISKKYKKNKKDTTYFTGTWSSYAIYKLKNDTTPDIPSVPDVNIDRYALTAQVDTYDTKTETIEFEVVANNTSVYTTGKASVVTSRATYRFTVSAGNTYKVRCRGINSTDTGEWSEYSGDVNSLPAAIRNTPVCKATSSTSVEITWDAVSNATGYSVEYTTKKNYFDSAPDQVRSVSIESGTRAEITGLDSGEEWFFRVKVSNSQGESEWSSVVSAVLGKVPSAPTTWSSTTTVTVNKDVYLYWIHNSEDGSRETAAQLELDVNGITSTIDVENALSEENDDETHFYLLKTSGYIVGAKIKWRVRTKGVMNEYGEWSVRRMVDVYAPPTLNLTLGAGINWFWDPFNFNNGYIYTADGDRIPLADNILTSFPLYVFFDSGPRSQKPIGYHLSIVANTSYQDTDEIGNKTYVMAGQEIFNRYYNNDLYSFTTYLTAGDLSFENGMSYTITATVSMDSGLTAQASQTFTVNWEYEDFDLDAEISFDAETVITYIRPYCDDNEGVPIEGVTMSVYRREFDGSFTEIATNLSNIERPTITDPHPALNYARYRIVGRSHYTGKISFYDLPGYPVGETAIVLQWDEEWTSYNEINVDELSEKPWKGSLLKLPYNVDVADTNDIDVEFVKYIGRKHPVGYYGTQVGQTATWNTDVVKGDEETLYALRRLAVWMGDVYVREPSGSGYWAQVKVKFNQNHCELTVPVTLEITRVEGGT